MSEKIIFSMQAVTKTYPPNKQVLKNIWLSFFYGAKIGVLGLNGSGKSTLLKIIAGLDDNYDGKIEFEKTYKIGYLPQEPELDKTKTVRQSVEEGAGEVAALLAENEEIGMKLGEVTDDEEMMALITRQGEVLEKIDDMNGWELEHRVNVFMDALRCPPDDKSVEHLSGGERRRVAMARLLIGEPDILLLDEPTNHLDMRSKDVLKEAVRDYKGALIVVSHDRDFLEGLTDQVLEFRDGSVQLHLGDIEEYLSKRELEDMRAVELQSAESKAANSQNIGKDSSAFAKTTDTTTEVLAEPKVQVSADERKARQRALQNTERKIERLEHEQEKLEKKLGQPDYYQKPEAKKTMEEHAQVQNDLAKAMEDWEDAQEKWDEISG